MARWIARVTLHANVFKLCDGITVRDSQSARALRQRRRGRKRALEHGDTPADWQPERFWKSPRIVAIRERILARRAQPVDAQSDGG